MWRWGRWGLDVKNSEVSPKLSSLAGNTFFHQHLIRDDEKGSSLEACLFVIHFVSDGNSKRGLHRFGQSSFDPDQTANINIEKHRFSESLDKDSLSDLTILTSLSRFASPKQRQAAPFSVADEPAGLWALHP